MEISTDKEEIKDELHELEDTQQDESEDDDEDEDEDEEVEEAAEWYDFAQLRTLVAFPNSHNNSWLIIVFKSQYC